MQVACANLCFNNCNVIVNYVNFIMLRVSYVCLFLHVLAINLQAAEFSTEELYQFENV